MKRRYFYYYFIVLLGLVWCIETMQVWFGFVLLFFFVVVVLCMDGGLKGGFLFVMRTAVLKVGLGG